MKLNKILLYIYLLMLYFIFHIVNYSIQTNIQPFLFTFLNNTLLIHKAIEDKRNNQIRILAAMYLNVNKSLIQIKVNGKNINYSIIILGLVIKFNIEFPLKYVNFLLPYTSVKTVQVNNQMIEYEKVKSIYYKYDFTLCITSLKNNFTAKTILQQTLDIYKKEGVSHAIIYYGDISKDVYNVLEKYVKSGYLEIFYWPQLEVLSYIRNYGQILKMNDCLYRSYFNSKYIINTDIDEIIMPKYFFTLKELLNHYLQARPNCGMFHFYSKTFPTKNYTDKFSKYGRNSYKNLPPIQDCNLFEKTLSCKETMIRTKYIISTKNVTAIRFHDAITTDEHCNVRIKDGHVRHTRVIPRNIISLCKNLTYDNTIKKYL